MSNIPADVKYTDQHEWLKFEGDVAVIGITDYAQASLGDLVFVELPAKGKKVKLNDAFVVVESVKAASEVYAPLSGEVVEVNAALTASPGLINTSPYGEGWICKILPSDKAELGKLLDAAQYKSLVG